MSLIGNLCFCAVLLTLADRASASDYPRHGIVKGAIIQLLVAADRGKPALLIRCDPSEVHTELSGIIMLIDHPEADRLHVGDRVDALATFDSRFTYRGVGGEKVAAAIYKYSAKPNSAAAPRPNQAMQPTAGRTDA